MGQFSEFYNLDLNDANNCPDVGHVRLVRNKNIAQIPPDPTAPFQVKHSDGTFEPLGGNGVGNLFTLQRFEINYNDFQPNATDTGSILLGTVPAGSMIVSAKLKLTDQFASTTDDSAGLIITINGPVSDPNAFGFIQLNIVGNILFQPVTDFNGTNSFTLDPTKVADQNNTADLYATLNVMNGANPGVINNLTSGQVVLWILTIQGI